MQAWRPIRQGSQLLSKRALVPSDSELMRSLSDGEIEAWKTTVTEFNIRNIKNSGHMGVKGGCGFNGY